MENTGRSGRKIGATDVVKLCHEASVKMGREVKRYFLAKANFRNARGGDASEKVWKKMFAAFLPQHSWGALTSWIQVC